MREIHILDNSLINKIAAGEVVERPSSVVKELTENSIDAGATDITIEIEGGGIDLIRITDNGSGIDKSQIETAFLRHATSKLQKFDDLSDIATLGFRGEALSSIASVAQVEMITKTRDSETGIKYEICGGEVKCKDEIGSADGTSIIIRNLFYNTPARRKFLKKAVTESGYVADTVNRLALGHPEIAIRYINNGNTVIQTNGNGDIKTAVFKIYGKDTAKGMLPVEYEENGYKLKGLIGMPEINRANRSYESFFINGRYIKSSIMQNGAENAYEGKLMTGKFPVVVLNMTVPSNTVDVNVHPTKLEVRFADDDFIYNLIFKAVEKALKQSALIPKINGEEKNYRQTVGGSSVIAAEKQKELEEILLEEENTINDAEVAETPVIEKNSKKAWDKFDILYGYDELINKDMNNTVDNFTKNKKINEEIVDKETKFDKKETVDVDKSVDKLITSVNTEDYTAINAVFSYDNNKDSIKISHENDKNKPFFHNYRIVGQIFGTYWIIEQGGSVFLIDQHAAHERTLYEEIIKKKTEEQIITQGLLQPLPINVNEREKAVIEENKELLKDFGFDIEEFGLNSYVIRGVPYIFDTPVKPSFFIEVLDMLGDEDKKRGIKNIYDTKLEKMASMSCKAAVKGNNRLSYTEAKELIEKMLKAENPFTCPHGRPTVIELTEREIEKMFKRVL